jgi:hypothetical protein
MSTLSRSQDLLMTREYFDASCGMDTVARPNDFKLMAAGPAIVVSEGKDKR